MKRLTEENDEYDPFLLPAERLEFHGSARSLVPERGAVLVQARGADPWVVAHKGSIYYTQTTGRDIRLWSAPSLTALAGSQPKVVWRPGRGERHCSRSIWAPELHYIDGRWYIYFAADDGWNLNHRMFVLESRGDVWGPYELRAKVAVPNHDRWAIDGSVLKIRSEFYFVWSGWPGKRNGRQNLYIAKMESPWELHPAPPVLVSQPEYSWESWINEGPQVLQRGDQVFLVYSANKSWTDHYRLGLLELTKLDPTEANAWRKHPVPVFDGVATSHHTVYAPGHCSFLSDSDGRNWILYHVAKYRGAGWRREVRAQQWEWSVTGYPEFGHPLPLSASAERPAPEIPSIASPITKDSLLEE